MIWKSFVPDFLLKLFHLLPCSTSTAGLTNVCLNVSSYSSSVFRLYSDSPFLYLDRLNVSYAIFHRFLSRLVKFISALRVNGTIKPPQLSFLLECGDISNPRLFFVSLQLLGYHGAQFVTLHKL